MGSISARRARLLVVEDDVDTAEALASLLRGEGYEVRWASDGAEALEAMGWRPDLVLLDLNLPDTSGVELGLRMRRQSDLPIIIASACRSAVIAAAAATVNAVAAFRKPFEPAELLAVIAGQLADREMPDDAPHPQSRLWPPGHGP